MPPLPADSIHARACKLKCEKILTRPMIFCIVSLSEVPMSQKKELHAVFSDLHEVLIYCFLTFRRGIFHNASEKAR